MKYMFVSWFCKLVKAAGRHSSEGEETGTKGPVTKPEPHKERWETEECDRVS